MNPTTKFTLEELEIDDVRERPDFDQQAYPRADGKAVDQISDDLLSDSQVRPKRAFLSIYYRLNKLYSDLARARESGRDAAAEEILKDIREVYDIRQQLEIRYAPMGFVAEPELDGLQTINLIFSYSRLGNTKSGDGSTQLSSYVSIHLSEEIQAEIFGETESEDEFPT